ncbi:hypothetical protein LOCC1_G008161 [Lachnellula occidentalis]|uniref:Hsp70 family protein n=1 Tax=Lachnellula occidentalis TaxID=215460 RepID=A0A8H8U8P7_9HELO|nr:hypothetical protein LOCC1_G008161 [Lachnellula occidentalis]
MDFLNPPKSEMLQTLSKNKTFMERLQAGSISTPTSTANLNASSARQASQDGIYNSQPSPKRRKTTNGISKSDIEVANQQNDYPSHSRLRDQSLHQSGPAQTHSPQRQPSDVSSTHQSKPPQQSDLNSRRKHARTNDHAVAAPGVRITKARSRARGAIPCEHPIIQRVLLQDEHHNDKATTGLQSHTSTDESPSVGNPIPTSTPRASDALDCPRKFIVGVDFGTTTTSVSYHSHPVNDLAPMALPTEVYSIMNWQGDDMNGVRKQVPTESWYSSIPRIRPPLQDQLGLDNLDPESSDGNSSDEEDTVSEASEPESPSMPHPETLDRKSNTYKLGACDCADTTEYIWGYDVFNARYYEDMIRDVRMRIERPKSMLVRSQYTQNDRVVLRASLDCLIERDLIRKYGRKDLPIPRDIQDVISDFLTQVLAHTGQQLTQFAGLTKQCPVSFVITVPVIWSPHSSRVYQSAMEDAIRHSGFGDLRHGHIDNLYITTEPEAAATYLLATADNILPGDTITILDCGGGTVDGSSHELDSSTPLRLRRQIGQPTGDNCGSSYLNDLYRKRLLLRLKDEHYLDCNGRTRESIVDSFVPAFEMLHKRRKNVMERPNLRLQLPGLKGDKEMGLVGRAAKRFERNVLLLNYSDFEAVFFPILERVARVLRRQLELATGEGKEPKV